MTIKAFQIYYDPSQELKLNPNLIPYYNEPKYDPFLENSVIKGLILRGEHTNCDYFGVFSWKFEKKHARSLIKLFEEVRNNKEQADVYSFFSLHTKPNLWVVAEKWHKGILEVTKEIFSRTTHKNVAEELEKIKMPSIYQNAFLARPEIYEDYVKNWLIPIMNAMECCDISSKLNVDTGYKSEQRKDHLKTIFGYPYYTLHPFVCERLFSTYLAYTNYKVKHIS